MWEAFKRLCLAKGVSTCEILELLILGVTTGFLASQTSVPQQPAQHTTINNVSAYAFLLKSVARERRRVSHVEVEAVEEPKAEGVVVSKPKVEVEGKRRLVDYSGWDTEDLRRELVRLREVGDSVSAQFVAFELKKRGVLRVE